MSRFHSYLQSACKFIEQYQADMPFAIFARKQFAANKKFGSTDRRSILEICYAFFRTSHLFTNETLSDRCLKALFLCRQQEHQVLAALRPDLNERITDPTSDKLSSFGVSPQQLFPLYPHLGQGINAEMFALSHLHQPNLFLRIRPGKKEMVLHKLEKAEIPATFIEPACLELPNGIAIEKILQLDQEVVVQDLNSQHTLDLFKAEFQTCQQSSSLTVWDACAASGGKSLLWMDTIEAASELVVSDIRKTILVNLADRFKRAGVERYSSFIADLAKTVYSKQQFEVIICDVPCTGSGTWSRTPEQLAYCKEDMIYEYAARQKAIATNASQSLKENGWLIYITCSVFKEENEAVVAHLQQNTSLSLIGWQYLEGYEKHADTLFVAVLRQRESQ